MSTPKSSLTILAAIDLTPTIAEVLSKAFRLAANIPNAEVFVVHVVPMTAARTEDIGGECLDPLLVAPVRALVAKSISEVAYTQPLRLGVHVIVGAAATEIARFAEHIDAAIVVIGTYARGALSRLLLGSVAQDVVSLTDRPVLLVRLPDETRVREVPAIEPLCADCAATRRATKGAESWCARHSEHHPRAHFVTHDTEPSEKPAEPWGFTHE